MNGLLNCIDCSRLATFLTEVRGTYPGYHGLPVEPFGDPKARLLIVGLAPGMHGANRTGRPFTGDRAGVLLYETLYKFGFSSHPESLSRDDGLLLTDCRITNAVKCLPPKNKPKAAEVNTCNRYLTYELDGPPAVSVILALGKVAHEAVLMAHGWPKNALPFGHSRRHSELPGDRVLFDSLHPSPINVNTRRLTPEGFRDVFRRIRDEIDSL